MRLFGWSLNLSSGAKMIFNRLLQTFCASLLTVPALGPPVGAQTPARAPEAKTAAEAYHNIQVLKSIPSDQLIPSMQFITYSLGVECSYCHVEGALEKDDKKPKLTARKMMQMMMAVNRENFDGKQVVTCNSCHRGSPRPVSIPDTTDVAPKPVLEAGASEASSGNVPPPEEIIANYVGAMGGVATLSKIKSRQETGTIAISGHRLPLEILNTADGKQLTLIHLPNGDSVTAYDGTSGWTSSPNHPARPIPAVEVVSARCETDLLLPLHIKRLFGELKTMGAEHVGDRETYVVAGMNSGDIAAKFYFDKDAGYLLRLVRYTSSPLGKNPTQIDYEDYRDQDGTKVPYRYTISRPNSRLAVQIEAVKFNVQVDESRFALPAMASGEK